MKEKDSENLEKESSDPKIICSACQKFTNILEKILQQTFGLSNFNLKYIPQKYICKKVYNSNFFKGGG